MPIYPEQTPRGTVQPAGMPTVFNVSADWIVTAQTNVKFICEVYMSRTLIPISSQFPVATLKASPNAAGKGMFDISPIIEAYVGPTYEGRRGITTENPNACSRFKLVQFTSDLPHSIHQIDQFCTNKTNMVYYQLRVRIEYMNTSTGRVELDANEDRTFPAKFVFNGVIQPTNPLEVYAGNYGYNMVDINYEDGSGDYLIRGTSGSEQGGRFISNMPTQQYIREDDYGTVAFFNCLNLGEYRTYPSQAGGTTQGNIPYIALRFYDASDSTVQINKYWNVPVNGGKSSRTPDQDLSANWIYFGHGLANMKGRGETWPASATGYEVYASDGTQITAAAAAAKLGGSEPLAAAVPPWEDECVECERKPGEDQRWRWTPEGECIYYTLNECQNANIPPVDVCERCMDKEGNFTGYWRLGPDGNPCIYTSYDDCKDGGGPPALDRYNDIGRIYRFDIIEDDCFGHKPTRLTWLNRLGAWDYYTFTKKSVKTVKSKRKNYQQLSGTWNEAEWIPKDHLGGTKVFQNTTKESIELNTDYMDEATATWLEELFTSTEVYIINDFYDTNPGMNFTLARYIHKYIEPVVITSAKYTKKTNVVDGLITYKVTIDKSKGPNIQRA